MLLFFCLLALVPLILSSPTVLFLLVDDLGWTDVSLNGAEYSTPNLNMIINSGIKFNNYYTHLTCSPTRASIMTGRYSWRTGLQDLYTIPPGSTQHIPFDMPTLGEILQNNGYLTYGLGKWHLGYAAWNMTPTERGFDDYFGYFQGEQYYYSHIFNGPSLIYDGYDFWDNKVLYKDAIGQYSTDLYTNNINYILNNNTNNNKPLFIYASFQTIHEPILNQDPPKLYDECMSIKNEGRRVYCHKLKYFDDKIGDILDLFKTYNRWDNTVVILSTDNGGMPYWSNTPPNPSYVSYGCNWPFRAGKGTMYEGGIKGIASMYGPIIDSRGLNGTISDILLHSMDWLPTIVSGIGNGTLPSNKSFDGRNMWNIIGNKNDILLWNRSTLYTEIQVENNMSSIIYNGLKYIDNGINVLLYDNWWLCNQTQIGNITVNGSDPNYVRYYLFNLTEDPNEYNNLYDTYPNIVSELRNMIQYQIDNNYMVNQDRTVYTQAFPVYNEGVWAPWLD